MLRFLLLLVLVALITIGGLLLTALTLDREPDVTRYDRSPAEIAQLAELCEVDLEAAAPYTIWREVDYREASSAAWFPRGESPLLAEMVARGELPPVAARVGPEPLVLRGADGIGTYGGDWFRAATSITDANLISWRLSGATLTRWSPRGHPVVPHVARAWESRDNDRVWRFHLRKGMRWSDGHPFTANDILYWWEDEINFFDQPAPLWMRIGGRTGNIIRIDEHTVEFRFPVPNPRFPEMLPRAFDYASPRHYLAPLHPARGDPERIAAAIAAESLASPEALYNSRKDTFNPDHPRLWPWLFKSANTLAPIILVRNPYYFAVDPAGNQLPYLDRMIFRVVPAKLVPALASRGDLGMQARHIRFEDYTLLMNQRQSGNYEIYHWFNATRSVWAIWPNLNRRVEADDPQTHWKAEYLNKPDFRAALSLAINREAIIATTWAGLAEPAQIAPGPASPHHHERLYQRYVAFDPDTANALLDAIGLDRRDASGFRTFPDGTPMVWYLNYTENPGPGPIHFVIDDWQRVGIRAIPRERSYQFFYVERATRQHDFTIWGGESEFDPTLYPKSFAPIHSSTHYAIGYARWYLEGGLHAPPGSDVTGLAPARDHPLRESLELYETMRMTASEEARADLARRILDIAADNLWSINIATAPPELVVVANDFRNVPRQTLSGSIYVTPINAGIETFYTTAPQNPVGLADAYREAILGAARNTSLVNAGETPAMAPTEVNEGSYGFLSGVVLLLAGAIAIGMRYPYIGRRLLLFIPTLLIISVITFVIIQAPPSDYIETRLLMLELEGDPGAEQEMENLKELFHYDDPAVVQYLRWMGVYWFATFADRDRGLLQGYLGRSMETTEAVNEMMGDRLMLTILISLGSILFTWALALPIGIYSAVRQYSWGDYIFTFVGFLGLAIPNFLLAIILTYVGAEYLGLSALGLFSPAYEAQPDWTWGKVVDLLKHIWIPILILGTGGTAGMIRVMRGNLLDELRKPYVTTARAKGVRPLKLILKYPVRLALNPFISGIGGILPGLISGGSIMAIVLALPTIGPLLVQSLLSEDMYVAGSMLMILSLLGVIGTLLSDLLLLALDPRIRMEGGQQR